ncbi:EexN family lipoprotein [Zooshikella marina]|uniref:EexN family lipoprotein n=1 Tax=Zooshikella ganghwensis TaxID=202772 RepID=UPI001BAEC0E9|nr:EexN family lipoprotein [Zooshikella ganghwensis]MBU2708729.1 EexN family lipoprotein [Zooshikella ganghwensis]
MFKYYISAVFISSVMLSGCGSKDEEKEVKTRSWYKNHPEERKAVIKACQDNPGVKDPNCVNAWLED